MALVLTLLALLAIPAHQAAAQDRYIMSPRKAVQGNDMLCGSLNQQGKVADYCRPCGGLFAVAQTCSQNPKCAGFDMETFACGYTKSRAGPSTLQYQEGFASFCKVVAGNTCAGNWMVYFGTDIGGEDLDCNFKDEGVKKDYCVVQGNMLAVMDACQANKNCEAFTIGVELNGKLGYLKASSASRVRNKDWITFVKRQT